MNKNSTQVRPRKRNHSTHQRRHKSTNEGNDGIKKRTHPTTMVDGHIR